MIIIILTDVRKILCILCVFFFCRWMRLPSNLSVLKMINKYKCFGLSGHLGFNGNLKRSISFTGMKSQLAEQWCTRPGRHTDSTAVSTFGCQLSLSYKTISKPTRCGSHSESQDVKNNKQGSPCVSALRSDAGQRRHSSLNPQVGSPHAQNFHGCCPSLRHFGLRCFNIPWFPPSLGTRHTVLIVMSWKWTFPEAGVSLHVGVVTAERRNCPFNAALFHILYRNSILNI